MVRTTSGRYAVDFLERLLADGRQRNFRRLTVCAPYVDEHALQLLGAVGEQLSACAVTLITRPEAATGTPPCGPVRVVYDAQLHAKVLLAVSREPRQSRALVTSANLTHAGAGFWKECGVVASPGSADGALVVQEVDGFLGCLMRKQSPCNRH